MTTSGAASVAQMGAAGKRRKWIDAHMGDKGTSILGNKAGVRDALSSGLLRASRWSISSRALNLPRGSCFLNRPVINPVAAHLHSYSTTGVKE